MKKNKIVSNLLTVIAISIFAISSANAAESYSQEAVEYYNAGLEYVQYEDYQNASLAFQKALDYDPEMVDAYFNLGSLYEHFGDYKTAIRAYTDVISLEPRDFETFLKIAKLYQKLNFNNQAIDYLKAIPEGCNVYKEAQEILAGLIKTEANPPQEPEQPKTVQNAMPSQDGRITEKTMEGRTENGGYSDPDKSLLNKYSSPTGITVDNYGNIFVASFADNTIHIVTPDEKNTLFSDSPMIDGPIGLASDGRGNLYVANYNKDNILKISSDGNVAIFKNNVSKPYSLSIKNNTLYVSEQGSNSVIKYRIR